MRSTFKTAEDFRRARRGRWRKTPYGMVVVSQGSAKAYGVITTKRLGGAVERNRVKRRSREALLQVLPEAPAGTRLLFTPSEAALGAKPKDLLQAFRKVI